MGKLFNLVPFLLPFLSYAASQGPCPCVPGGTCDSQPYGSLAQDISVLGLFGPCPHHGQVRCCSRAGLENLYDVMLKAAISQERGTRIKVRPVTGVQSTNQAEVAAASECGCIPRGICMPHLTRQTADCSGQHELCCINARAQSNVLVNIFSSNKGLSQTTTTSTFNPQPVFRPNGRKDEEDEDKENPADQEGLPCLEAENCSKLYGYDALDIARFGVLTPCSKRGFHRCVEPKIETTIEAPKRKLTTRPPLLATTSTTTTAAAAGSALLVPPENVNLVPCVQHHKCIEPLGTLYNPSSGNHLSRFGVLPQCSPGMIRCILELDLGIFAHTDNINLPIFKGGRKNEVPANKFFEDNAIENEFLTNDNININSHKDRKNSAKSNFNGFVDKVPKPKFPLFQQFAIANKAKEQQQQQQPQQQQLQERVNPADFQSALRLLQGIAAGNNGTNTPVTAVHGRNVIQKQGFKPFHQKPKVPNQSKQQQGKADQVTGRFASFPQQSQLPQQQQRRVVSFSQQQPITPPPLPSVASTVSPVTFTQPSPPAVATKPRKKFRFPFALRRKNGASIVRVHQQQQQQQLQPKYRQEVAAALESPIQARQTLSAAVPRQTLPKFKSRKNFFSTQNRKKIFQARRPKHSTPAPKLSPPFAQKEEENAKSPFADLAEAASVTEDPAGNLVISGGRHVVHLPPGISPPGQPNHAAQSVTVASEPAKEAAEPVFFDPQEAPHVVEALRNSKKAVIQVQTDDNRKMVLNVKNDQLLSILQALSSALDTI